MGLNLTQKILEAHHVDFKNQSIAVYPDQVLTHDATGTPVFLQLEAMEVKKVNPTTQVVDRKLVIQLSCVDARGKLYNSSPEST